MGIFYSSRQRSQRPFRSKVRMTAVILLICAVVQSVPTPGTNVAYYL